MSNDNQKSSVEQKLINKKINTLVITSELNQLDNSVLDEQINDNNCNPEKKLMKRNKIFLEPESSIYVNTDVQITKKKKSDAEKGKRLKEQIRTNENRCDQLINIQESHIENSETLINIDLENIKSTETPIETENVNELIADHKKIIDKEYQTDSTLSEKIQNVNECSIEKESIVNKSDKQKCSDITENNKENLVETKENNEISSISDDRCENEKSEQKENSEEAADNVEDNSDDVNEEEEIIFYYINSGSIDFIYYLF